MLYNFKIITDIVIYVFDYILSGSYNMGNIIIQELLLRQVFCIHMSKFQKIKLK